uniref:NADH-ubiquinone oxidoreductase chain 2 n=1 Tax=Chudania hellerina TaxID=2840403 RepID=A0A8E8L8D9_9HEMI|nr:NADH dehydrogenase subunit 2 [Chudania hellerina]
MKINSTLILLMTTMTVGVLVSLSSNSFMMMWIGLEISMISFVPFMTLKGLIGSESSMKYFIVQSVSSSIFMLGIMIKIMYNMNFELMISISLLIKIGMAPFHSWVLTVIEGLNYFLVFILISTMKIVPLFILSMLNFNLNLVISLSLIIGSVMGLNQISIRKLMGYSSIFNMGFLVSVIKLNSLWIMFFIIYSIMVMIILYIFYKINFNYLNQIMINEFDFKTKTSMWMCLLSMGGMPPLMGFLNKIMIFEYMFIIKNFMILFFMMTSSLMVMFYYTRISLLSLMNFSLMMKWNLNYMNSLSYFFMLSNLMLFMFFLMMKSLT